MAAGRTAGTVLAALALLAPATAGAAPPTRAADCAALAAGTAGLPYEPLHRALPDRGNRALGIAGGEEAPPGLLHGRVPLRTATESFNRRYEFAAREGRIWFRSNAAVTGIEEPWRALALPDCLDGEVAEISADDDQLIALDGERRIFTLDGILGDPALFSWTWRWGPSFWTGLGHHVPADARAWSYSDLSPSEDVTWTDPAGNEQRVGGGKVSTIYVLRGDGRRITILDPWLPNDESYEVCGPERDRFVAETVTASGSTVLVANRYGDIYTRLWDFDISGSDPVFFDYSYEDQRGRRPYDIQLPAPDWVRQPKVPGEITDRISIHKVGTGSVHRIIRVEGRDASGATGYWEKDLPLRDPGDWTFHPTGDPLRGDPLDNGPADRTADTLGPRREYAYSGAGETWVASVEDFHAHCTPATLRVTTAGASFTLVLHAVDGLRQRERATDLDATPRTYYGTIEVPAQLAASEDPAVRAFLDGELGGRRFTEVDVLATEGALEIPELGWELRGGPAGPGAVALDEGELFARAVRRLRREGVPVPNFARGGLGL